MSGNMSPYLESSFYSFASFFLPFHHFNFAFKNSLGNNCQQHLLKYKKCLHQEGFVFLFRARLQEGEGEGWKNKTGISSIQSQTADFSLFMNTTSSWPFLDCCYSSIWNRQVKGLNIICLFCKLEKMFSLLKCTSCFVGGLTMHAALD